jgi:hypothetical protein
VWKNFDQLWGIEQTAFVTNGATVFPEELGANFDAGVGSA